MQLSITDFEAELLRQALSKNIMLKGFLKKIDTAELFDKERSACKHIFGLYVGKKKCCIKCGGLKEGMGESWELEKTIAISKNKE